MGRVNTQIDPLKKQLLEQQLLGNPLTPEQEAYLGQPNTPGLNLSSANRKEAFAQRLRAINPIVTGEADNSAFKAWYADWAGRTGLDPNPDDPRHKYDYRAAFKAGAIPTQDASGEYHWPSEFKADDHPNRFIGSLDTKTGEKRDFKAELLKIREQPGGGQRMVPSKSTEFTSVEPPPFLPGGLLPSHAPLSAMAQGQARSLAPTGPDRIQSFTQLLPQNVTMVDPRALLEPGLTMEEAKHLGLTEPENLMLAVSRIVSDATLNALGTGGRVTRGLRPGRTVIFPDYPESLMMADRPMIPTEAPIPPLSRGVRPPLTAQQLRLREAMIRDNPPVTPESLRTTSETFPEIPRPPETLSDEMETARRIAQETRPGGRPGHVQKKTPGSTPEELAAAVRGESRASVPPKSESMPEIPRPPDTLADEMAEYHRYIQEVFTPKGSARPDSSGALQPPKGTAVGSPALPTGTSPEIPPRSGEPVEMFAGFPVEPTRLSKAVDGLISALTPAGRVPRRGEWLRLRDRTFGFMGRWERSIDRVFDPMKNWPEETKKSVFRFLDGELPIDQVPEAARRPARSARRMLDQVGAMLVDRGLIEREAYDRLKGQYVRYLYAKHLLPDEAFKAAGGPGGRLNLKALRGRKDLSDDLRDALGLIEDPHIAGKVGLSQSIRNIGLADYLQSLSSVPDWVHPGSFVDMPIAGGGAKRVSLGELSDEAKLYREMAKRDPRNEAIQNHLASLQAALDDANARLGELPRGFVPVPNTPEWGPLRGTHLRKEIFQDLRPMFQIREGTGSEILDAVLKGFRGTTAAFKVAKVPLDIPTAMTNVVSNFFQGAMGGVPVHKMPRLVGSSLREMLGAAKGDRPRDWNRAMRGGLFNRNWSVGELNEVLGEWGQLTDQSSLAEMVRTTMKLTKYYGKIDDVFKLAWFKNFREAGMAEADAVSEAMKWGMDYSLVHPAVRKARENVAPFISYQANLLPLLAESLKKRPWIVLGTAAFPWVVAQGVKEYHDLSEEDWRKMMQSIPTYLKENPTEWAILPVKDPQGNWQWVNFGKFTPWGNIVETAIDVKQGEFGPAVSRVSGNPWLGVYSAFRGATGGEPPKDPFFGIPIYNRLDPPRDKFFKTLEFVYNQWAPSMLTRYGATGKTVGFMTGTEDRYGRVPTLPETAGRWVGLNIARPTPEQASRERAHHIFEAREDLIKILRDPTKPEEKKEDARKRFQERLRYIRGE